MDHSSASVQSGSWAEVIFLSRGFGSDPCRWWIVKYCCRISDMPLGYGIYGNSVLHRHSIILYICFYLLSHLNWELKTHSVEHWEILLLGLSYSSFNGIVFCFVFFFPREWAKTSNSRRWTWLTEYKLEKLFQRILLNGLQANWFCLLKYNGMTEMLICRHAFLMLMRPSGSNKRSPHMKLVSFTETFPRVFSKASGHNGVP